VGTLLGGPCGVLTGEWLLVVVGPSGRCPAAVEVRTVEQYWATVWPCAVAAASSRATAEGWPATVERGIVPPTRCCDAA
jgi:hypothetical protein